MKQDIRLFLGNKEVEFNATPQILYNYTETDLTNPATVKNSFTKSVTVDGTQNNNDLFGHIWNLERYQQYIGENGPSFNPNRKVDFKLFVNGSLYEQGYCKLNSIVRSKSGNIQYSLTLYGGLGSMLSNLQFVAGDDSDSKLTLADLNYDFAMGQSVEDKLSWTLNKDELYNAWGGIAGYSNVSANTRHQLINYVPTYCGTPEDFSLDKVLINNSGMSHSIFATATTKDGKTYGPLLNGVYNANGWSLGEFEGDLSPWNTFDIRSYLTQPAIRMKYVIQACGDPSVNGGYELALDSHFFNSSNPYWEKAWVTLPKSKEEKLTQPIGNATMTRQSGSRSGDLFNINYTGVTLPKTTNARAVIRVGFTPSDSTTATTLYTYTRYLRSTNGTGANYNSSEYISNGGVIVQLWAMDANNNIVGSSNAYLLASDKYKANSMTELWWNYYQPTDNPDINPSFTYIEGEWRKINGNFVFCNRTGDVVDLILQLNSSVEYDHLVVKIKNPYTNYYDELHDYDPYYYPDDDLSNTHPDNYYEINPTGFPMYRVTTAETIGNINYSTSESANRVRGGFSYSLISLELTAEDYSRQMKSTLMTKKSLLGTEKTPADYLLSYAKTFGLYFYYDPTEDASNTTTYPKGVVHLMDRDTFFTEAYENLEEYIDYSRDMTITPTLADSKWLELANEDADSSAGNAYLQKYGYGYGRQLINTSFNFNSDKKNILDKSIFRGGVMVREQNALFKTATFDTSVTLPVYVNRNGFSYKLFSGDAEDESDNLMPSFTSYDGTQNINNLGLPSYDSFPKLQLHTDDNSPSDGSGILLFLNGSYSTNGQLGMVDYYITDDVTDMAIMNDDTPCYILTKSEFDGGGHRIARKINAFPNFTRDIIVGASQEGNIIHSWNFGHPQSTFIPNVFSTDGDSIYDKCWKNYISDLYDVNTKKLSCFVRFKTNLTVALLRKFFWFKNSLWRLNAIKDYNVNSFDTTQCEFIKVQDVNNYKLSSITDGGTYYLTLSSYEIGYQGGTINGTVYLQGGGSWSRASTVKIVYINGDESTPSSSSYISPATGTGESSNLVVTIPANNTNYTRYITITINYGDYPPMTATITQAAPQAAPYLAFNDDVININADGGSISAGFTKQNVRTGLTATSNVAWIYDIAVNESTNTVTASVSANTGYQRSGKITLNGTGINGTAVSAEVQIDQTSGGPAELSVQPDAINFDYLSTSGDTIYVSYGGSWTITEQDQ